MLEVTRIRLVQDSPRGLAQTQGLTSLLQTASTRSPVEERLGEMVCTKLGQLPPQRSNVLLVGVEGLRLTQDSCAPQCSTFNNGQSAMRPLICSGTGFAIAPTSSATISG